MREKRQHLIELREAFEIDQRTLSVLLNLTDWHFCKIEGGYRNPTIAILQRFSQVFDTDLDEAHYFFFNGEFAEASTDVPAVAGEVAG